MDLIRMSQSLWICPMNQGVRKFAMFHLLMCFYSDPGKPLDASDFFLASQLPKISPNMTTEMMMKV